MRRHLAVDLALLGVLASGIGVLAGGRQSVLGLTVGLSPLGLTVAIGAVLLALAFVAHGRLALDEPAGSRLAWSGTAAGALVLFAVAVRDEPGVSALLGALVPLAALPALTRSSRERPPSVLLTVAALAVLTGGVLPVALDYLSRDQDPTIARVTMVLGLLHVALLGALAPAHLWLLGRLGRGGDASAPLAGLALAVGMGGLAGAATLASLVDSSGWLLAMAGVRPMVASFGWVGVVVGVAAALGEVRPVRMIVHFATLSGGAAVVALGSGAVVAPGVVVLGLVDRAIAIAVGLLAYEAVSAVSRAQPEPTWRGRLLSPARLPYWLACAWLIGLPPTLGFTARWLELVTLAVEGPVAPLTVVAGMALALFGLRRVVLVFATTRLPEPGKPTSDEWRGWRTYVVPLVLGVLGLALGLFSAPLIDALLQPPDAA